MAAVGKVCANFPLDTFIAGQHPLASSSCPRTGGSVPFAFRRICSYRQRGGHVRQVAAGRASLNPLDDPILSKALQEPVAFFGGLFAGLLQLDLSEDPLREWVSRTAEAAGVDLEEKVEEEEDGPVDITIE